MFIHMIHEIVLVNKSRAALLTEEPLLSGPVCVMSLQMALHVFFSGGYLPAHLTGPAFPALVYPVYMTHQ